MNSVGRLQVLQTTIQKIIIKLQTMAEQNELQILNKTEISQTECPSGKIELDVPTAGVIIHTLFSFII